MDSLIAAAIQKVAVSYSKSSNREANLQISVRPAHDAVEQITVPAPARRRAWSKEFTPRPVATCFLLVREDGCVGFSEVGTARHAVRAFAD